MQTMRLVYLIKYLVIPEEKKREQGRPGYLGAALPRSSVAFYWFRHRIRHYLHGLGIARRPKLDAIKSRPKVAS